MIRKSFQQTLHETARAQAAPVTGDTIEFDVNRAVALECAVVEHSDNHYVIELDDIAMKVFESCGVTAEPEKIPEAEYQGRKVDLNKPMRGDVKKYKVYVKDAKTGNVRKVNFGDPNMEIKRDDPAARKNFRARHNCSDKKDKTKAGYWSCKMWSAKPVSKILKGK